mgnify:CR=1 FL=1
MKENNTTGNKTLPKKLIIFSILLAVLLFSKFLLPKFQQNSTASQSISVSQSEQTLQQVAPADSLQEVQVQEQSVLVESVTNTDKLQDNSDNWPQESPETAVSNIDNSSTLDRDGIYTSKEDVALYIHLYKHLPGNFIKKKEAQGVNLREENKCIGGDRFHNREGILPKAKGRTYTECDIDTLGKSSRGPKRIVFSNDGLIYYTSDHYQTFVLLYGEEK